MHPLWPAQWTVHRVRIPRAASLIDRPVSWLVCGGGVGCGGEMLEHVAKLMLFALAT